MSASVTGPGAMPLEILPRSSSAYVGMRRASNGLRGQAFPWATDPSRDSQRGLPHADDSIQSAQVFRHELANLGIFRNRSIQRQQASIDARDRDLVAAAIKCTSTGQRLFVIARVRYEHGTRPVRPGDAERGSSLS